MIGINKYIKIHKKDVLNMFESQVSAKDSAVGFFLPNQDSSFTDGLKAAMEATADATNYTAVKDFEKIISDDTVFDTYRDIMFGDVLGDQAVDEGSTTFSAISANCENNLDLGYMGMHDEKLGQLIDNTRQALYEASTVGQLQPIVALTMPLMKKAYIKAAYKDAIQTVTADKMLVNIGFERDFLKDRAGKKYYLPDLFYPENESGYREVLKGTVGKEIPSTLYPKTGVLPFNNLNLLEEAGGSLATRDVLGYDLHIASVTMKVPCAKAVDDAPDGVTIDASGFKTVTISGLNIKPNYQTATFSGEVRTPSLSKAQATDNVDTLVGSIQFYSGEVSVACTAGLIQQVSFGGHLSSANNDVGTELDRERHNEQIPIPEQERLNTGLTVEKIRDEKMLSNIDVTVDTVSKLSDTCYQFKDTNTKLFLEDSFQQALLDANGSRNPMGYTIGLADSIKFELTKPERYMLPQSEWRTTQLRYYLEKYIIQFVQKLKNSNMMVVLVANPTMISYLDDVKWVVDEQTKVGGVKLDYKFGVTTIAGVRVHIISTMKETLSKGFRLIGFPLTEEIITYRKYDYSFFIENNYRNLNTPLIPNVMVAQRYLNYEYLPMQSEMYFDEVRNDATTRARGYAIC